MDGVHFGLYVRCSMASPSCTNVIPIHAWQVSRKRRRGTLEMAHAQLSRHIRNLEFKPLHAGVRCGAERHRVDPRRAKMNLSALNACNGPAVFAQSRRTSSKRNAARLIVQAVTAVPSQVSDPLPPGPPSRPPHPALQNNPCITAGHQR